MGDPVKTPPKPTEAGIVDTTAKLYHDNEGTIDTIGKVALGAGVLALLWYLISNSDKIIDFLIGAVLLIGAILLAGAALGVDIFGETKKLIVSGYNAITGNGADDKAKSGPSTTHTSVQTPIVAGYNEIFKNLNDGKDVTTKSGDGYKLGNVDITKVFNVATLKVILDANKDGKLTTADAPLIAQTLTENGIDHNPAEKLDADDLARYANLQADKRSKPTQAQAVPLQ